ncbi:NADH-quinone oxidoreductase subunit NuoE [Rickettsia endosymbiont of Cardiosporidium cionae]|uniref:NADH-quinone oxidoreductase subunit NuoE n=1 Tax=Rickettsia endosymbiont of Cardiosporidium cionae TaxID=2777155 RepID=UPI001894B45F|nr:NADH-quinone oxidoreductase subunit NuoE [Rickettsia endosymbiont of Cardiosporidium cionae]KAF8818690.1 NADH-quinone oxidoreductase subunit NuoE [Rickettsia endosymbiont of Cardiosporidium cionae]
MGFFAFSNENLKLAEQIMSKYPADRKRSALLPLLELAQRQNHNWISKDVMEYIADFINISVISVYEVVSFYTMFNLKPVGKYHIQICSTTPCWLRGSSDITNICKKITGIGLNETSKDGLYTLSEIECLGACVNAPVVLINDDYYEKLTAADLQNLLNNLK